MKNSLMCLFVYYIAKIQFPILSNMLLINEEDYLHEWIFVNVDRSIWLGISVVILLIEVIFDNY